VFTAKPSNTNQSKIKLNILDSSTIPAFAETVQTTILMPFHVNNVKKLNLNDISKNYNAKSLCIWHVASPYYHLVYKYWGKNGKPNVTLSLALTF
jgi:hypothetical protein